MRALVPWTGMNGFKDEMDRLLDRLFEPRLGAFETLGDWMPKLDLSETKDAYAPSRGASVGQIRAGDSAARAGRHGEDDGHLQGRCPDSDTAEDGGGERELVPINVG